MSGEGPRARGFKRVPNDRAARGTWGAAPPAACDARAMRLCGFTLWRVGVPFILILYTMTLYGFPKVLKKGMVSYTRCIFLLYYKAVVFTLEFSL